MKIVKQSVTLIQISDNADQLIEDAARVCYQSWDKKKPGSKERLIKHLIKSGHHSVLEHAFTTFKIVTNRAISHEIVRHRIASYSQESTRYVAYKNEIEVIKPYGLEEGTEEYKIWYDIIEKIEKKYKDLLDLGVPPQNARDILPNCLKTELYMTANFREWRHFIKLRSSKQAHPQIRELAIMIRLELQERYPILFEDL